VTGLVGKPAWIIDGNFGDTLAPRVAAADTIRFLEFFHLALFCPGT